MVTHAIVLGGAECVWMDLVALERTYGRRWDGLVVACNDVGVHYRGRIDAWTSLHADKLLKGDGRDPEKRSWWRQRADNGYPMDGIVTYSRKGAYGADRDINEAVSGGSSGLLAVQVAWNMGADRVTLCGVPMTVTPHFAETECHTPTDWRSADSHWRAWKNNQKMLEGRVRSFSGRTRDVFGAPTYEWLAGREENNGDS